MKPSSFNECKEFNQVKHISPDFERAKALERIAQARIQQTRLRKNNANFVFEDHYTSLLEVLHAHLLREGLKVDNHICIGFYLRDVLKEGYELFDDLRYKRNSLTYYGLEMEFDVCTQAIRSCQELIAVFKQ